MSIKNIDNPRVYLKRLRCFYVKSESPYGYTRSLKFRLLEGTSEGLRFEVLRFIYVQHTPTYACVLFSVDMETSKIRCKKFGYIAKRCKQTRTSYPVTPTEEKSTATRHAVNNKVKTTCVNIKNRL
ncbi:hypothetical protein J6590_059488 [Homalodisca vitripennis]|nr:hypothetical protein J6590_059488 [Homalodisca vitripennis]